MAAKLSAISACFMRGRLPSASVRPARWVTPISVPALSNTSTNRKLKITIRNEPSATREKSSCSKVGASDGGAATTPLNFARPERNADQRDDENADQRAADDAAIIERRDQDQAEQAQDRHRIAQIAERDQRRRRRHHDLRFLERDDAEKQSDAGGDRELQIPRDRIDDVFANAEDRDQKEDHARAEHRGERLLPGVFHRQHDGEGEERVEPHAGRQRDRIIGVERHHQGRDRGGNAGGDEHRALVHAGIAEDLRIDEDDVDHRQKRGQAGDEFGAHIAARLRRGRTDDRVRIAAFARGLR